MYQEFSPSGHSLRPATPAEIRRIRQGGEVADKIRKQRELEHEVSEVPKAENFLKNSVWESVKKEASPAPQKREKRRQNFWERILAFLEGEK